MSAFLDKLLEVIEAQLPEVNRHWISDLRQEAAHIPAGFTRMRFQGSGLLAAIGQLLRVRFGPQKLGQWLLGAALSFLCLGGFLFAGGIEQDIVRTAFYCVLPVYFLTGILTVLNLVWMKRFSLIFSFLFCVVWAGLSLQWFPIKDFPIEFLRAFTLEAAFIMAGLFIAATYLSWMEEADHA